MQKMGLQSSCLFMEDTLPRFQTSAGTPMNLGSFAQCLKITSCRYGRWLKIFTMMKSQMSLHRNWRDKDLKPKVWGVSIECIAPKRHCIVGNVSGMAYGVLYPLILALSSELCVLYHIVAIRGKKRMLLKKGHHYCFKIHVAGYCFWFNCFKSSFSQTFKCLLKFPNMQDTFYTFSFQHFLIGFAEIKF